MSAAAIAGWKGIDAATLADAGVTRRGDGLVEIPYRLPGGAVHNVRMVSPSGRQWWRDRGLPLLPFGLESTWRIPADRGGRDVWMAEGESDALDLRSEYSEWRGHGVDVLGLPGAATWRPEWATHIAGYAGAYLFPDADRAGERMVAAVTKSVPWVVVVRLPEGRDVRDVLQADGTDKFDELIVQAEGVSLMLTAFTFCPTIAATREFLAEVTW